ncbi:MAG: transcription elongation factor GreA [Oscillospiraceae bacterium]|nr:transcription elongation factor GreA [Oscillospiraceae bacterium]
MTKTILTQEGLEKLQNELDTLKTVKRREVAEKIKTALSFGDLSENSEYDEAKNEQGIIEARISQIEATLMNVEVLDAESLTTDQIQIGNKIKIKNVKTGQILELSMVGSREVDMKVGKISNESPVGSACMGSTVGEIVEAETPSGAVKYEILEISK